VNIKSILVSQPEPKNNKNPFSDLADKFKLKVDFRSFIHVEGVVPQDFRKDRINLSDFTAVIFTSRMAVDHFFRIAGETRFAVPDAMKYFCISEAVAFYLQNYVVYRKRKIFYGKQSFKDLMDIIIKHKDEKYLVPCSDIQRKNIPELLSQQSIHYKNAILYKTVCSDLSDLKEVKYDMLVFYSPSGIQSLVKNFPDFEQNGTKIAAYGPTTAKAAEELGLRIDIKAPSPGIPSMTMAIEQFINKNK